MKKIITLAIMAFITLVCQAQLKNQVEKLVRRMIHFIFERMGTTMR